MGHERGLRLQNIWNEGALMVEEEEKIFERVFVETLTRLARDVLGGSDA